MPTVNVTPYEFVFEGFTPSVEADTALDGQSAQSAVRISGRPVQVRLLAGARRATIATPLPVGAHTLEVENLHSTAGARLVERLTVPFFVVRSAARLPRNTAVHGFARLAFGALDVRRLGTFDRPRGSYVEVFKAVDRATWAPVELAFDQNGRAVDLAALRARVVTARARKFGRMSPSLFEAARVAGPRTRVSVAIWAAVADAAGPLHDKAQSDTPDAPSVALRAASSQARDALIASLRGLGVDPRTLRADDAAPVVYATLSAAQVRAVAAAAGVGAMFLDEDRSVILDLDDSVKISNADDAQTAGYKGSGVKVAVWEDGPSDTSQLSITSQYDTTPPASAHARLTHAVIKNTQTTGSKGYAPSCSLYSANSAKRAALTWAAQQGCTVISQSFHRREEPRNADPQSDDIYKDWLALQWPYPTIVQAAGNYWAGDDDDITPPEDEYVNHKGYNSLSVGNHDDTAGAMSGSSVFRNPSSAHGDRELPEICGNGTGVSAVGESSSGTSFAAPAVAGCAALIQSVSATLKSWPEGCRAILLAGARKNVRDSTWWKDVAAGVDARDGAGAVDAQESAEITKVRAAKNNAGSRRGWDVGTLRSADFGADRRSTFEYRVTVPPDGARHVKVALAWNSKVSHTSILGIIHLYSSKLTLDMDIMVYDRAGALVGYSGSWDNSYEIAEFDGKAGETYSIRVRRWSGTDDTWYGLAWTVT